VGLHGLLGLDDPIGFLMCLVGFSAQLWLTRKNKRLLAASAIVAATLFLLFETLTETLSPRFSHWYGRHAGEWTTALIEMWCLTASAIWFGITLRNRTAVFNESRRALLRSSTAAICAAPAAVFAFGILTRKETVEREVDIKFPGLPRDLENLRLVQISDVHLSAFYSEKDLARVIDEANSLRADLAIMTGDLITTKYDPLEAGLRQLARLKNNSGIWACLGNHEHFAGVEDLATSLGAKFGVNFLRSQGRALKFGQNTINLVGVDFQSMRSPYLQGVEELVESDQFNILLSHNPDVFPVATGQGFDLVLAGHTHGGQINVEIFDKNVNIADFVTPYTKGLYKSARSAVYVNSGIGTIGMPVRLGAPPEITLIKLCAS
jgi:predicted MPP superfamily phosphohydrolase